jgi:hypothetical protein
MGRGLYFYPTLYSSNRLPDCQTFVVVVVVVVVLCLQEPKEMVVAELDSLKKGD